MKIYKEIKATVGQVIKDLEEIAEKNSGSILEYSDDNANQVTIADVKFEAGFAFLVSSWKDEGMAVEKLLENLRSIKDDTKILLDSYG